MVPYHRHSGILCLRMRPAFAIQLDRLDLRECCSSYLNHQIGHHGSVVKVRTRWLLVPGSNTYKHGAEIHVAAAPTLRIRIRLVTNLRNQFCPCVARNTISQIIDRAVNMVNCGNVYSNTVIACPSIWTYSLQRSETFLQFIGK